MIERLAVHAHVRGHRFRAGIVRRFAAHRHAARVEPRARLAPAAIAEIREELIESPHREKAKTSLAAAAAFFRFARQPAPRLRPAKPWPSPHSLPFSPAVAPMLPWISLLLSVVLVALGALNLRPAPATMDWRLAVLANTVGHWLAVFAVAIAALAWAARGDSFSPGPALAAFVLSLAAVSLLARPTLHAARLARRLPATFDRAFGPTRGPRSNTAPAFSWTRLFCPGFREVRVETLTTATGLPLDFHRAAGLHPAPCVIVIHGGGWDGGDRGQLPALNHQLAHLGYAVAAISYRLAPHHPWPAQRDDVRDALAFLRDHAAELGLDPTRLVLLGRSAGGQIAEAAACTWRDPAIRGVIAFYAPADLAFAYQHGREDDVLRSPHLIRQLLGGPPAERPEACASASAWSQIDRDSPPMLLIHGRLDTLVWHRQSERLAAKLAAAGVPHVFLSLPWATHAFDYAPSSPGAQLTLFAVARFLAAVAAR